MKIRLKNTASVNGYLNESVYFQQAAGNELELLARIQLLPSSGTRNFGYALLAHAQEAGAVNYYNA